MNVSMWVGCSEVGGRVIILGCFQVVQLYTWLLSGGPVDQTGCERAGWVYGPAGHTGKYLELDVLDTETYRQSYSSL